MQELHCSPCTCIIRRALKHGFGKGWQGLAEHSRPDRCWHNTWQSLAQFWQVSRYLTFSGLRTQGPVLLIKDVSQHVACFETLSRGSGGYVLTLSDTRIMKSGDTHVAPQPFSVLSIIVKKLMDKNNERET